MKVSLHWLKRFVDFELSASELADKLTMRGFESEVVTDFSQLGNVVVGDVLSAQKHPDADKLKLCTVSDGKEEFDVVCGAPNVEKGQKIVFAKVGAILPGDFKIGKAKIRGVESFGMICSERELGISEEHEGIMVLDDDIATGIPIEEVLGPIYNAIDIEVTPDKAFALSHRGIAREVAAMIGTTLKIPLSTSELHSNTKDSISIELDKKNGCTRYMAGVMKGVKVGPSPKWLADYLKSVGQKSINNLVDISNFMLLEIGHPTHIFDLKKLAKPAIKVSWAKKGEKFHALDDETYTLESDHMVITDTKNTIALAGIIGGMDSAVSDDTSEVLIESAYFDPVVIRKGSKKLNLLSEASRRFERGTDPNAVNEAFHMIVQLMQEVAGGSLESIITDECNMSLDTSSVKLSSKKLVKYAGQLISDKDVEIILDGLHIKSKKSDNVWECTIPTFRTDLLTETDLIEEVFRCYGYDKIKSSFNFASIMQYANDEEAPITSLKHYLSSIGFNQSYNNSLEDLENVKLFGKNAISVMNPSSERMNTLRSTLHQGLLKNLDFNYRNGSADTLIYEYGTIFSGKATNLGDIDQQNSFSCLVHGDLFSKNVHFDSISASFSFLKGVAQSIYEDKLNTKIKFIEEKHSYCSSFFTIKDSKKQTVGAIGVINPSLLKKIRYST
jgi:phenylalanyl-tRNA synthetase beta chain